MLKYEFEKDLLEALEKALQGTDAIAAYAFNIIVPVIEKHAVEQGVQADSPPLNECKECFGVGGFHSDNCSRITASL